jgi:uncharacterized peroxidase-related enzyme
MNRIKIIEEDVAEGKVKDIYTQFNNQMGMVPNVIKVLSIWPEFMEATSQSFGTVMMSETELPRATKEMIAAYVSNLNQCSYCVSHHVDAMQQYGVDNSVAQQISQDFREAGLDEKTRKLLEYSEKVSKNAYKVVARDFDELRNAGWSDRQILEATAVVAQFNFVNRIADALGVELESVPQAN